MATSSVVLCATLRYTISPAKATISPRIIIPIANPAMAPVKYSNKIILL